MPKVLDGSLPANEHEVAVTENYLTDSGLSLGDTVTLEDNDNEVFERTQYTITASVIDPTELTNPNGSIAIRANASPDYSFFVTPDAVTADAFTAIYVKAENNAGAKSFSPEYSSLLDNLTTQIEGIKKQREEARTQQIRQNALDEIAEAEAEVNEELSDAQRKIDDAQSTLFAQQRKHPSSIGSRSSTAGESADKRFKADRRWLCCNLKRASPDR